MASAVGSQELVASAQSVRLDDVPAATIDHATRVVADTLGVIFGGGKRPEIEALVRGDDPLFPSPAGGPAQLLMSGMPGTDPTAAAFVNATAGTFLELDEGFRPTGHPSVHVVPAALAAAQALHATGREFLATLLSGYEVTARLFEAFRLTYPLHPHGHFGAVGAAVAVARLRGVDAIEPASVAATLPLLPVWQPCTEGATARNAYTGTAAAIGLTANRLAAAGFTGSREAQEAAFGGLVGELVCPEALNAPVEAEDLRITRNYLKLHSACALSHSALDAVLALEPLPATEEVESVEVETVSNNMKIAGQARPNDLSTRFSLPYAVATAIIHGHTRPEAFVYEERVAGLAERVEVRSAADLEDAWPDAAPARVTIRTRDGDHTKRVDNPRGHHSNPASADQLRSKFEFLVGGVYPGRLYERLLGIEDVEDVAALFVGVRMKKRPRVLLVALGGTISATPDERGHGVSAQPATDILAALPEADGIAEIFPADVKRVPSRAITPSDMCVLAHEIQAGVGEGYDGVVVTHGTDTMEETAYALALQLDVNVPVVLTGAMRLSHETGADGPANLLQALRVATTPAASRLGPVVVMHEEVHLARWATKTHTSRVAAFSSPGLGPVGYVVEGRVRLHASFGEPDRIGMPDTLEERVELVWVSTGADGLLIDAASSVAQGLVVAGTGGGHVPPAMTDSLRAAVERGLPVVLASRCASGPVLEDTYGGVGSETQLLALGLHPAGTLAPIKARLRLMIALALGKSAGEVFPV